MEGQPGGGGLQAGLQRGVVRQGGLTGALGGGGRQQAGGGLGAGEGAFGLQALDGGEQGFLLGQDGVGGGALQDEDVAEIRGAEFGAELVVQGVQGGGDGAEIGDVGFPGWGRLA